MGRWIVVTIYRHAKRRGIYLALFTNPEGDSCFSIYQISWVEMKKITLFTYLQTFRGFVKWFLRLLLQIQHENNFLPTSNHRQAKVRHFSGISLYDCFIYRWNSVFRKCLETRRHLGSGRKTVKSQGYSKLRESIKTRENCYSLIW